MRSNAQKSQEKPILFESSVGDKEQPQITHFFRVDPVVIDRAAADIDEIERARKKLIEKMKNDPNDTELVVIGKDGACYRYFVTGGVLFKSKFSCRYIRSNNFSLEQKRPMPTNQKHTIYRQNPVTGEFEERTVSKYSSQENAFAAEEDFTANLKFIKKKLKEYKPPDIQPSLLPPISLDNSPQENTNEQPTFEVGYDVAINMTVESSSSDEEDPLLAAFDQT